MVFYIFTLVYLNDNTINAENDGNNTLWKQHIMFFYLFMSSYIKVFFVEVRVAALPAK